MRAVETKMIESIVNRQHMKSGNTIVDYNGHSSLVYLHDQMIARVTLIPGNSVSQMDLSLSGHPTPVTRSRLNAIYWRFFGSTPFNQKKKVQYLNHLKINPAFVLRFFVAPEKAHLELIAFTSWEEINQFDLDRANKIMGAS